MTYDSYSNPNTPLLIYIIFCFFGILISICFYKNTVAALPSVFAMSTQLCIVLICCISLIIIGMISVRMEWICMIICVMLFSFNVLCIINPEILLYNNIS